MLRAFQDDVNLGGPINDLVECEGKIGARKALEAGLTTERHLTKTKAYGLTPGARAQISPDMEQPFLIDPDDVTATKHFGIELGGAAVSLDPVFTRLWLRNKAVSICEIITKVSADLSMIDAQVAHAVNNTSMQTLADYVMATHLPSETRAFAATAEAAWQAALARHQPG